VIFAHEADKDQKAWQSFAAELAGQGIAALTFDFRGYGETGGTRDLSRSDRELTTAVLYARSRDYPLIYIVGAGSGGTAAIKVAARQEIAGLVTVSAPLEVSGLDARSDVAAVREPKLFIAGRSVASLVDATSFFLTNSGEPKQSLVFEGTAQGSGLLSGTNATAFKGAVIAFVTR
jgi:alpha/beta superfamily hydrolase